MMGQGAAPGDTQPTMQNYTQFGPMPFGPYGRMDQPGSSSSPIPTMPGQQQHKSVIPVTHPLGHMGPAGAMGGAMGMMGAGVLPGMPGAGMPGMMGAPASFGGAAGSPTWNPAFGMGLIPHMNAGNVYNPAFPAGNPADKASGAMGMQNAWAAGMPGVAPTYDPNMAIHHGLNLPGGMGQFKDPAMNPSMGQGYPHPDMDRYSSVYESIPAPGGEAAKAAF